jgi:adenylate kinase family enzyme
MRLHVLGASGSGVTTLGKALADRLNIPYFDADEFYWEKSYPPFTVKRNQGERNLKLETQLNESKDCVLGGSVMNWDDALFSKFDLIIFLYIPKEIRIHRLRKRELERHGEVIYQDAEWNKRFEDFISWAADYDDNSGIAKRTLVAHEAWMEKSGSQIIKIFGDLTTEERVNMALARLNEGKVIQSEH